MAIYKSKTKTKDGRQYFFRTRYKNIYGQTFDYKSQKYFKRKDAEIEEALFKAKMLSQTIETSNITLKDVYTEYLNYKMQDLKKQSLIRINYQWERISILQNKKINELSIMDYKLLRQNINKINAGADYKNKIQERFAAIIRYSNKYHNTNDNILKYIEKFKDVNKIKEEMLFFTFEEYQKFIENVDLLDYKTFFEVLYFLGLRQGECQALTWKDIDFQNKTIHINKTLTTKIKGEKWTISSPKTKSSIRTLPIPKNVLNDLKMMYNEAIKYRDFKNNWFIFGNSVPFKESTIQQKKNIACDKAQVKRIRIHDFRHSCASLLINKGASIALVSKYLGHSNITITLNTYTHMYKSELENMTKIIENL